MRELFNLHQGQLCISSATLMELIYGAEKSAASEKNLAVVESFAARVAVLDYDALAAEHMDQLRAKLAKAGKPIGPYDQIIAAHARSQGPIIVTNNVREFEQVPGLRIEDWANPSL